MFFGQEARRFLEDHDGVRHAGFALTQTGLTPVLALPLTHKQRREEDLEDELSGLRDALASGRSEGELSGQLQEARMTRKQIPDRTASPAAGADTAPPPAEAVKAPLPISAADSGDNAAGGAGDGWGDEDGWGEGTPKIAGAVQQASPNCPSHPLMPGRA